MFEASQSDDAEEQPEAEADDKPARMWSAWSHVIAGLVFCLLYFPFDRHPWAWPLAVAVSYSAFVFSIGLGLSLDNADVIFGDPRIAGYVVTLLPDHTLILVPVTVVAYLMLAPFLCCHIG